MSESDDDWFEKDIDEFVVQTQQPSNVEHISVAKVPDADNSILTNIAYTDAGSLNSLIKFQMFTHLSIT